MREQLPPGYLLIERFELAAALLMMWMLIVSMAMVIIEMGGMYHPYLNMSMAVLPYLGVFLIIDATLHDPIMTFLRRLWSRIGWAENRTQETQ